MFFFSDIGHLDLVLNRLKLSNVNRCKWKEFGLSAGLHYNTLNEIEYDKETAKTRFCECVASWLRREDGVENKGIPTLLRSADIVEETGDRAAADDIRNKIKAKKDEEEQEGK